MLSVKNFSTSSWRWEDSQLWHFQKIYTVYSESLTFNFFYRFMHSWAIWQEKVSLFKQNWLGVKWAFKSPHFSLPQCRVRLRFQWQKVSCFKRQKPNYKIFTLAHCLLKFKHVDWRKLVTFFLTKCGMLFCRVFFGFLSEALIGCLFGHRFFSGGQIL